MLYLFVVAVAAAAAAVANAAAAAAVANAAAISAMPTLMLFLLYANIPIYVKKKPAQLSRTKSEN